MRPSGDRRGVQKVRDPARAVGQRRSAGARRLLTPGCAARVPARAPSGRRNHERRPGARRRARGLVEQEVRGVILEALLVIAEARQRDDGCRGFTSRIGFAVVVMRPAPASSRSSWRSGPCSAATRQTALSVGRSETRLPTGGSASHKGKAGGSTVHRTAFGAGMSKGVSLRITEAGRKAIVE
jgi:hypothetical protein